MPITDVYERLARHLDSTPAGFPRTPSGVELRILRKLFTPGEAEVAVHLTMLPEEPRVVARRARLSVEETVRRLEAMEGKGLLLAESGSGPKRYMALQFVVGFWESQVDRLDRELVEAFEAYHPDLVDLEVWRKAPQMRIVPVEQSITAKGEVMPYEHAERLVREARGISVSNCICRQEMEILHKGCGKPMESCIGLGGAAASITKSGRGRAIDVPEALAILARADEAGLVLQASNSRKAIFLCTCCGCCCGVLRALKRAPSPAAYVSTPFVAVIDPETCNGCSTCEARCQMEALSVQDGTAVVDADRCIGCGLCVTACPTEALSLRRKPEPEQPYVPKTIVETYLKLGRARGRFGARELVGMQVRSKIDRLLS
jgi:Na+-translocating ferredoxin:NAD+ oxidoreductase subunit B